MLIFSMYGSQTKKLLNFDEKRVELEAVSPLKRNYVKQETDSMQTVAAFISLKCNESYENTSRYHDEHERSERKIVRQSFLKFLTSVLLRVADNSLGPETIVSGIVLCMKLFLRREALS